MINQNNNIGINKREVWGINEFEFIGDYPIECDKCHNDEINITLNNK